MEEEKQLPPEEPTTYMDYLDYAAEGFMNFAPLLVKAVLVIIVGFWLIKKVSVLLVRALERSPLAPEVVSFLVSLLGMALKAIILISAIGIIGVDTASIMALLATAGLAIGLALQGSLANFAAGILVMVFRPYRMGDWVEVADKFGKVEEVQIFHTVMVTPGLKTLIIPNGQVIDNVITNYSKRGFIRIELEITMPYEESFPRVRDIIREVLVNTPKVLDEPVPEIGIISYDSHNIIVGVRPYVLPDDYWEVTFEVYERIKKAFNNNQIKVAYSEGVELGPIGN